MRFAIACLILLLSAPAWADMVADEIVVVKSKRTLTLYNHDHIIKTYHHIALGAQPYGPKMVEGDNRTPEGFYTINKRLPNSEFHLALQISYPDELDIEHAQKLGVPPGDRIMIHGRPDDYGKRRRKRDWTHGCISVSNREMDEIWQLVPDGTPIEIRP